MVKRVLFLLLALSVSTFAQEKKEQTSEQPKEDKSPWNHSFKSEFSYAGEANMQQGTQDVGEVDSQHKAFEYTANYRVNDAVRLRAGVGWEHFGFGTANTRLVPNTLQSVAGIVGADVKVSENWTLRFQAEPGIYSDFQDLSFDDLNMPVTLGAGYSFHKDLQLMMGMRVNARSSMPVTPGLGVRWKFLEDWTLMLMFPSPRLSYEINKMLSWYVGADMKGGTFQVAKDFGRRFGRTDLDNDVVEYREIRTGTGMELRVHPAVSVQVEGGWVWDRRFSYDRSDLVIDSSDSAPYGQVGLKVGF